MPRETLLVTLAPDGTVTVEVQGCPGPACQTLSRGLETALGQPVADAKTPEYYQRAAAPVPRVRLDQS